jgi:rhodanese-related sulfurtransferase
MIAGFVSAPGGQLQQATDQWVGVRGARLVLADSDGVRAPMVAAWLRQLGHDASVMTDDAAAREAFAAAGIATRRKAGFDAGRIRMAEKAPADVAAAIASGRARVIDVRSSAEYRRAHVPGSVWSIRPRLAAAAGDAAKAVVLVADNPAVAKIAALDLAEAGVGEVALLSGGIAGWQADGRATASSETTPPDRERIDFVFHTLGRNEGNLDAARAYLAWETNLVAQLDAQERGSFRL